MGWPYDEGVVRLMDRDPKPENDNINEAAARVLARSAAGSDEETVALFAQKTARLLRELKERLG